MMRAAATAWDGLSGLATRYGLALCKVDDAAPIPGSYWGAPEAGLMGSGVYARPDTPLHSVLHETAHVVCMTSARRATLATDAGGDDHEESAVCFLQVVWALDFYDGDLAAVCRDMDAWGYSFRLGSARAWFERDAGDALAWLRHHALVTRDGTTQRIVPTYRMRDQ